MIVATSKHNVQYLLGGHRAHFFDYMDAIGITRYLPVMVYRQGRAGEGGLFRPPAGKIPDRGQAGVDAETQTTTAARSTPCRRRSTTSARPASRPKRIAVEFGFLPYDASKCCATHFPDADWVDALFVLERQRAKKSADELAKLKIASEPVIDSMQAVIAKHGPGATKDELVEALRREETNRGMTFEYCLITAGTSLNRAPSDQIWGKGDIMSIDSGGNYHGYIGDICRMAIHGEPDAELVDMLGEIETIQRAALKPVKAGRARQGDLRRRRAAGAEIEAPQSSGFPGARHGPGQPRGAAPAAEFADEISGDHANMPLEAGMVVSVETTLHASDARLHQARGHRGRDRHGPRDLRRGRARLEQGRHGAR